MSDPDDPLLEFAALHLPTFTNFMQFSSTNLYRHTFLLLALFSLKALAEQATPQPPTKKIQPTHACQPNETVGFSCELKDGRLLSLCASPGFDAFEGRALDHPGYAYLALSAPTGDNRQTFPPDPRSYKQHMYSDVTLSGWPYLVVSSSKGDFFYMNLDREIPAGVQPAKAPDSWSSPTRDEEMLCHRFRHRLLFDSVLTQMVKKRDRDAARSQTLPR